jgi:hypothetical protein
LGTSPHWPRTGEHKTQIPCVLAPLVPIYSTNNYVTNNKSSKMVEPKPACGWISTCRLYDPSTPRCSMQCTRLDAALVEHSGCTDTAILLCPCNSGSIRLIRTLYLTGSFNRTEPSGRLLPTIQTCRPCSGHTSDQHADASGFARDARPWGFTQ